MSRTISRVLSRVIICLGLPLPTGSSDLPGNPAGHCIVPCLVLLQMEFTCALSVTTQAVVSYTAISPLPRGAVYFCCTGLGVASTGRYPASCPVKPGLSSPAKGSRDHLSGSSLPGRNQFESVILRKTVSFEPAGSLISHNI